MLETMLTQGEINTFVEVIEKDPHILNIRFDSHLFPKLERLPVFQDVDIFLDSADFLFQCFYVFDDFSNHSDRRSWRDFRKLHNERFYDFYEMNVLRFNVGAYKALIIARNIASEYVGSKTVQVNSLAKKIDETCMELGNGYNSLDSQKKYEFVHNLKNMLYCMVNIDNLK
ncbi:hypothetical protein JXM83_05745 [Candidatus Woesearchaeota archaeon]|nr:hypothetical protein [Candidatus Woesearchaeota archaeon]